VRLKKARQTAIFVLVCWSWAAGADTYAIDPIHSMVGFSVLHMLISHVSGDFQKFSGTIVYDEKDPSKSSVNVHIKAVSIDTRNHDRDEHLRSSSFFDAAKFPEITFASTRIEKTEDGYIAHEQLTIRGVSKEVTLPFKITGTVKDPWGKTRLGAQAGLTINRQDFGVSWNQILDGGGVELGTKLRSTLRWRLSNNEPQCMEIRIRKAYGAGEAAE
jgi:polyisoprenoid-binding protein YceI